MKNLLTLLFSLFIISISFSQSDLEVEGKTITDSIQINNGATEGYVLVSDTLGNARWMHPDSVMEIVNNLKWIMSGDTLYNDQASFVGIGTNTPTTQLEVAGGLKIDNNTLVVRNGSNRVGIGTDDPSHRLTIIRNANAITGNNVDVSDLALVLGKNSTGFNGSTGLGFRAFDGVSDLFSAAVVNENLNNGFAPGGKLHFATRSFVNGNVNIPIRMTIDQFGNAGIGTRSPTNKLDINGQLRMRAGSQEGFIGVSDNLGNMTWTNPDSIFDVGASDGDWSQTDSSIFNETAEFVGIGTTFPSHKLNIADTSNALLNSNTVDVSNLNTVFGKYSNDINEATGIGFQSSTNSTNIGAAIIHERTNIESKGKLHFATKTSTSTAGDIPIHMTISDDGSVGIGTINPTKTLDVAGDVRMDGFTFNVNAGNNRVGIGTGSPTHRLSLHQGGNALLSPDTVDVSNLGMVIKNISASNNQAVGLGFQRSSLFSDVGAAIIHERTDNGSKGKLHFATKTSTGAASDIPIHMSISDDGGVGIGTTNPDATLEVHGTVKMMGSLQNRDFNTTYTADTDGFLSLSVTNSSTTADAAMSIVLNLSTVTTDILSPEESRTVGFPIAKGDVYEILVTPEITVSTNCYFRPLGQ